MHFTRINKIVLVLLAAFILASTAYAFAASNTVPASRAGDGSATISGYSVTSVAYTLSTTDPTKIQSVAFTLDATATDVRVSLVNGSNTFYTCTNSSGNNWTCSIAGAVTVLAADSLQVVAVQ